MGHADGHREVGTAARGLPLTLVVELGHQAECLDSAHTGHIQELVQKQACGVKEGLALHGGIGGFGSDSQESVEQ